MLKRRYKRICLLGLIITLMVNTYTTVFLFVGNSRAHSNQPMQYWYLRGTDTSISVYRFEDKYGPHDWVADSALRLILDSAYADDFIWLLKEQPYGTGAASRDNIPFNEFDSYGLPPRRGNTGFPPTYRKWVVNYDNILGDVGKIGFYKAKNTEEVGGRKWLHSLRYVALLHGTSIPDYKSTSVGIVGDDERPYSYNTVSLFPFIGNERILPREHISKGTKSITYDSSHRVLFAGHNKYRFYPEGEISQNRGAYQAQEAGHDAVYFLTFERKKGSNDAYDEPKYIAACMALGIMAHYVTDVSVPQHVIHNEIGVLTRSINTIYSKHKEWENWFADIALFTGGPSATFPNGGPDWDEIDPRKYDSVKSPNGLKRAPIFPLPPYEAVVDMAHITFSGWDPDNGFGPDDYPSSKNALKIHKINEGTPEEELKYKYAAYHMFVDPAVEGVDGDPDKWGKNLLKWAVYYTACAYLWVMKEAKERGKTIGDESANIDQALQPYEKGAVTGSPHEPLYGDDWSKQYEDKYISQSPHYDNQAIQGLMISAGLLVPALALILIPLGIRGTKNTSKKED